MKKILLTSLSILIIFIVPTQKKTSISPPAFLKNFKITITSAPKPSRTYSTHRKKSSCQIVLSEAPAQNVKRKINMVTIAKSAGQRIHPLI